MAAPGRPVERAEVDASARANQSLARGLAVLDAFKQGHDDMGITEISRVTGLKVSTVHRIVRTLVACGYVEQNSYNDRYRLGVSAVLLGEIAGRHSGLNRALPELEALRDRTGEAVNLGVRDGTQAVVLVRVECKNPLRFEQPPGSRIPLQVSAMGKTLLAFGTEDYGTVLRDLPAPRKFTERTRTKKSDILRDLQVTKERGYGLNDEERDLGVRSIGAPIKDERGIAFAAISLQGPAVRITVDRIEGLADDVKKTADVVSGILGARRSTNTETPGNARR
jgi:IclR family transcriptional regulator, acetate operon repressor